MRATTIKLIAIVLLAGALRVLAAFVVQDAHVSWDYEYEIIAQNLVQGNGYAYDFYGLSESQPTSFQPPVYPLFLAGLARLAPGSTVGLAAMQILLSLLSIVLLFKLTCAQGGSTAQGLLAALMLAAYPPINLHAVIPSSVTLEILFLLAGVLCTLRSQQSSLPAWPLAAGLSFGMASLTRSPWLVAIPIAMLWTSWQTEHAGLRRWRTALLLLGAALLTFFPWALHNRQVNGAWSVTGTNGGINFWIGNNPEATGEYIFPTQIDRQLVMETADWPERQRDRFFYQQGIDYIREHPDAFASLALRKLAYFLFFRPSIGSSYQSTDLELGIAQKLFIAGWLLIFSLGLAGLWIDRQHRSAQVLLIAIILGQAAVTMLYFAGTRFRTPLEPFFMIWAAGYLVWLLQRWRARREEPLSHA